MTIHVKFAWRPVAMVTESHSQPRPGPMSGKAIPGRRHTKNMHKVHERCGSLVGPYQQHRRFM